MNTQADTCLTCGGLIMVPGTTYGWGGKICYCPEPPGRFRRRAGEESQNELETDRDRWKKRAEDMGDKAHDTWDEIEKAKARIEELTHLWAKDNNALVDALLQNKRLVEALEWIANYQYNVSGTLDGFTSLGLIGRAKSALSGKEPSK